MESIGVCAILKLLVLHLTSFLYLYSTAHKLLVIMDYKSHASFCLTLTIMLLIISWRKYVIIEKENR